MSTDKPKYHRQKNDNETYTNHLQQQFRQKSPNLVWVSDLTYLKAGSKWYYLCIVMDLFSRKVIAWHISSRPDAELVITTFKKAYKNGMPLMGSCFTPTGEASTPHLHSGSY